MRTFRSLICLSLGAALAAAPALAASYDIKDMTPAVQQALDGRKSRYSQLRQFKSQGLVGESHQGYVEATGGDGSVRALAEAENRDRRTIYETIVQQHQLGAAGLPIVQAAFAEVQRDKAQPGDLIQLPSGDWVKQ